MNRNALRRTLAVGALSGMRSLAGPMALARSRGGSLAGVIAVLGGAEMIADKTSFVGDRIDPLPLAGRAAMGGLAGAYIAHEYRENMLLGGLLGAASAVAAAHLAFQIRKRLPVSNVAGGALEDAVVIGLMQRI